VTAGSGYKYDGQGNESFLDAARLIARRENVHILAAGPIEDRAWREAREESDGRIRAYGPQNRVRTFHAAADVYAEGFPVGSLIALHEAALAGLPCVLAARPTVVPFLSDGPSLARLVQPTSIEDYAAKVIELIDDPIAARQLGASLREQVQAYHCDLGWRSRLETMYAGLPDSHQVYDVGSITSPTDEVGLFWLGFRLGTPLAAAENNAWGAILRFAVASQSLDMAAVVFAAAVRRLRASSLEPALRSAAHEAMVTAFASTLASERSRVAAIAGFLRGLRTNPGMALKLRVWLALALRILGARCVASVRSLRRSIGRRSLRLKARSAAARPLHTS
jgi:hypothetical protein